MTLSLLLVDSVRLYSDCLADAIRVARLASEIHTVADGTAAAQLVRSTRLDVVLINMAAEDGLPIIVEIRGVAPHVPIIVLAVPEAEDDVVACAEVGATGFLPRTATLQDLAQVIESVLRGETICSPRLTAALLRRMTSLAAHPDGVGAVSLTPREREVVFLIERGMSNKQIARELSIEIRTVKNHVHNLLAKLRVQRRGEAAACVRTAPIPPSHVLRRSSPQTRPDRLVRMTQPAPAGTSTSNRP